METLFRLLEFQEINMPHVFILGDIIFHFSLKYTLLQQDNTQTAELEC